MRLGRPSPGTVLGTIAVVVALGGTGYAASTGVIARGGRPEATASKKALTAKSVRAIVRSYLKRHPAPRGSEGPIGPQGPQGAQGPQGPTGIPPVQTLELPLNTCQEVLPNQPNVPLVLPAGATILQVRAKWIDTSTDANLQFGLFEHVLTGPGSGTKEGGGSSGSGGGGVTTLAGDPGTVLPPTSDTIDYDVYANPAGQPYTGSMQLCGVAVDYRLAAP